LALLEVAATRSVAVKQLLMHCRAATSHCRKYEEERYEAEGIVEQEAMEAAKARAIITTEDDVSKSSLSEVKDEYDD
jgi:hypothetical protein